jgi:hypothetical protein
VASDGSVTKKRRRQKVGAEGVSGKEHMPQIIPVCLNDECPERIGLPDDKRGSWN